MRESLTPTTLGFQCSLTRAADETCWPEALIARLWEGANIPLAKECHYLFERTHVERILHVCGKDCGDWGCDRDDLFPHEKKVVRAVVQWFATNVGRSFLQEKALRLEPIFLVGPHLEHMLWEAFKLDREDSRVSLNVWQSKGLIPFIAALIYEGVGTPSLPTEREVCIVERTVRWFGTEDGCGFLRHFLQEMHKESRMRRAQKNPIC